MSAAPPPPPQPPPPPGAPQAPAAPLFVGLDGGGTRTRVAVIDGDGDVVTRLEGGASIVDPVRPDARVGVIQDLVERALGRAGGRVPAAALCCALAGAGRDAERSALASTLADAGIALRILVTGDGDAALRDAFGPAGAAGAGTIDEAGAAGGQPEIGVLLIGGTGSIAWGREAGEPPIRVGGWGALLGDEGSAHALALAALRGVARAEDGRGPVTVLTHAVLHAAGVADVAGLVTWAAAADKAGIAALAPAVLAVADTGDAVAAELAREAIGALADHVEAVLARLARARAGAQPPTRPDPVVHRFRLALSGGLLAPGGPLRDAVLAEIRGRGLEPEVLDRPVDAAVGAAELAREAAL